MKHTQKEHNLWNYLFFIIQLRLKEERDYNGTESYVFEKLNKNDISWFPIGRAMILTLNQTKELEEDDEKILKLIRILQNKEK